MKYSYMEDCIHLRACRRLQKVGESKGHRFARKCDEECTAYETDKPMTREQLQDLINRVATYVGGDGWYGELIPEDFQIR